jgi:hypothetical protein
MPTIGGKSFTDRSGGSGTPIYQRTGGGTGGGGAVSKYTTGWSTSVPQANSRVVYTHNLGTDDIQYQVFVRDTEGFEHDITGGDQRMGFPSSGAVCLDITTNTITIGFLNKYSNWALNTLGYADSEPYRLGWGTATHIKVVVIG